MCQFFNLVVDLAECFVSELPFRASLIKAFYNQSLKHYKEETSRKLELDSKEQVKFDFLMEVSYYELQKERIDHL